ncbi:MAG: VCBS repeat-containing protein [Verrucomicrobiales bacterium]|nr:VCBS repeat-containing protein [Verrucomicrobiales bacterium]
MNDPTCRRIRASFLWRWALLLLLANQQFITVAADPLVTGYRALPVTPIGSGSPGFTRMTASETGFDFTNRLAQSRFLTNQIHLNGSGVALGDIDGDGWCDIFLTGLDGPNALYRNLGGWRFTNITAQSGLEIPGLDATGAMLVDMDGDGDLDAGFNTIGSGTFLLLNDGRGRFTPAEGNPFNRGRGGMSAAWADMDGDGDLDAFVGNYRCDTFRDQPGTRFRGRNVGGKMVLSTVNGRPITEPDLIGRYTIHPSGTIEEHGEPDLLLRNEGSGRFSALPLTAGSFLGDEGQPLAEPPYDWTLSVAWRDINQDGAPDLYLCNDFSSPDELWLNDGKGRFRRAPSFALRHLPMFSMGVDFADLNHDGFDDFIVADMLGSTHASRHTQVGDFRNTPDLPGDAGSRPAYPFNQLFIGRGDGSFAEIGWYAGVTATDWTWNLLFLDVDLDGEEDLLCATGHELEMMNADIGEKAERMRKGGSQPAAEVQRLKLLFPRHNLPNHALRNRGGLRFTDATDAWRFGHPVITTGMAVADLDNDGDLDVVGNNLNDPAMLLRNDASQPRLAVRLVGRAPNTRAIGARIRVTGGPTVQEQEIMAGGRYLASDDATRTFATGTSAELRIEVTWPNRHRSLINHARPNHRYEIVEADTARSAPVVPASTPAPWFQDASSLLSHEHHEEVHDDFATQPLLPAKLSQLGPGVGWIDWNRDGRDELVVGSGRGGTIASFEWRDGRFQPFPLPSSELSYGRDILGLAPWWDAAGRQPAVLFALANWEDGTTNGPAFAALDTRSVEPKEILTAHSSSFGAVAVADFDGDGDLDAFVAGHAIPARFPEPASSQLLRNEGGVLVPVADSSSLLTQLGVVHGAIWSDLEGDGYADLVVTCDWGSLRVFRNRQGRLESWDPAVTRVMAGTSTNTMLSRLTGGWTGLASVDLDADGRLDLVVGNWGLNSRWQLAGDYPVMLYYGDYDDNGSIEILEAAFIPELHADAPLRTLQPLARALPFVRDIAPDHQTMARTTVPMLLGPRTSRTRQVQANTLSTVLLRNRGSFFEMQDLPAEAQWTRNLAVVPADFDGDGNEDVFLSQNFFAVGGDLHRQDAGRGLVLRGDGQGGLHPVRSQDSGVVLNGEQRGAAVSDVDADGRVDLVVAQNGGSTAFLRNRTARPGLRIRLNGPPGNPDGIGARLRLKLGDRWGPTREIAGGSGWLSFSSPTAVLAMPTRPSQLEVRWPGGKVSQHAVGPADHEISVAWRQD